MAPARMLAVPGEMAIEVRVFAGAATVRVALPVRPSMVAVTVVEPAPTAVASPEGVMVATFAFASVQVAAAVTSAVELSLYVAVALNCSLAPMARFAVAGEAAIAVMIFVEGPVLADEDTPHPTLAANSGRERQSRRERSTLSQRQLPRII